MMSDPRELYQQVILDHYKTPRNAGELTSPTNTARGDNPLCGDKIHLQLLVKDGVIEDIKFSGSGCAISTASASLMTESVKGKPIAEAHQLFESFRKLVMGKSDNGSLGKLAVFAGVRDFPVRVKCATLAWHTLEAALSNSSEAVTTE